MKVLVSDSVNKTARHWMIEIYVLVVENFTQFNNMQNLSMIYNRNKGHSVLVTSRVIIRPTYASIYTDISQYHRYSDTANIVHGKCYIEIAPKL